MIGLSRSFVAFPDVCMFAYINTCRQRRYKGSLSHDHRAALSTNAVTRISSRQQSCLISTAPVEEKDLVAGVVVLLVEVVVVEVLGGHRSRANRCKVSSKMRRTTKTPSKSTPHQRRGSSTPQAQQAHSHPLSLDHRTLWDHPHLQQHRLLLCQRPLTVSRQRQDRL